MARSLGSGNIHNIKGPLIHFGTSWEDYQKMVAAQEREDEKNRKLQKLKDKFEKEQKK